MPTTRKKIIKTVYKDENSDEEDSDFSDSGSDAKISDVPSSEDEAIVSENSSADEFHDTSRNKVLSRKCPRKKTNFAKVFVKKINKQISNEEEVDKTTVQFSIKDLTDADKLLPSILNLSESDSSDDESQKTTSRNNFTSFQPDEECDDKDMDVNTEYRDVWSNNAPVQDNSEEIAKKTFMELEQHKSNIEETKEVLQKYRMKKIAQVSDVKDLLAMGEELPISEVKTVSKKHKLKRHKEDSDSEMEDWEEVKEKKEIPQQGIQLFVEFPDAGCRKSKKVDVEMMMKRKINRVKKEYQVYMHKVHVLCWLGHGNYVSKVLNDQELMAAALSLVPSKECYPGERVDMKYVEQIMIWYKDKLTLNQDKNEDKFKPKAPPLKTILLDLIKKRMVTTKKYLVFIFVTLLRALGLQCRVMFNFVTVPIKPPITELCSLSTKDKEKGSDKTKLSKLRTSKTSNSNIKKEKEPKPSTSKPKAIKQKIVQLDGQYDVNFSSDSEEFQSCYSNKYILSETENIMQVDGNDDTVNIRRTRSSKRTNPDSAAELEEDVSPPKIPKKGTKSTSPKPPVKSENKTLDMKTKNIKKNKKVVEKEQSKENESASAHSTEKSTRMSKRVQRARFENNSIKDQIISKIPAAANTNKKNKVQKDSETLSGNDNHSLNIPNIIVTNENKNNVSSKFFEDAMPVPKFNLLSRNRSKTANAAPLKNTSMTLQQEKVDKVKVRTKSAPPADKTKSKYFDINKSKQNASPKQIGKSKEDILEDKLRVNHRDLAKNNNSSKKTKTDITGNLIDIVKNRIKEAKIEGSRRLVKGKNKKGLDEDCDYLPEEDHRNPNSDDDFKPTKISPKPGTSARRIDRRVISSSPDVETSNKNKIDVWCEIFVEELEQWISVDVIKGKIHSTGDIYTNSTHPVCYIVGWDNNNYLKDLTRKYVPQYNTVTRKLRAELQWWTKAISPYLGPKTPRDREEDEYLDRMQLEAPLPKSIAEYKNHPLYALKRHLLKFEAIFPPDAAILGFVRGEPVYGRECVYVCRSRDTWLKEAKVVKLGQQPYKVVKARPKWDKLSNKLITDKPLEVFGIWQVQDYEPPVAENGIVPRNAYGNVELFKDCMLPIGTVHIKLPGLNRVAKKLNIDCAPAMTGFDFNGGWSHPVYDGFVVCKEFEEIVTEAWVKDQEEQERREREKIDLRVYGNWKRLIKCLMIRERLKAKYGFEEPATSSTSKGKSKAPRLVVKKKT